MRDASSELDEKKMGDETLELRRSADTGQPSRRVRLSSGSAFLLTSGSTEEMSLMSRQFGDQTYVVFSLHARSAEQECVAATARRQPALTVPAGAAVGALPAVIGADVVVVVVVVVVVLLVVVLVDVVVVVVVLVLVEVLVACIELELVVIVTNGLVDVGLVLCAVVGSFVAALGGLVGVGGSRGSGAVSSSASSSFTRCEKERAFAHRLRACRIVPGVASF